MQAGKSFKELQEAYRNGARAFPVDAGQNSLHVSSGSSNPTFAADAQPLAHFQWTGSLPQFNHANAALDQVGTGRCTCYRTRGVRALGPCLGWAWPIWSSAMLVFLETASMAEYSVHHRKPAELLYSLTLKLTTGATPMQTKSFLLFLSLVSGATTLTIPPQGMPHLVCIGAYTDIFSSSNLQKLKK
jgi:hypothetical protein